MSTDPPPPRHTLDAVLRPRSVAVIGASNSPTRIGGRPIRYLLEAGFQGPIYPVNPKHQRVQGLAAVGAIDEVTDPIDLAIVAVPAPDVIRIVETCAARGVRAVVIFSAGFAETGTDGRDAQRRLSEIAASTGMRIVGPNCLGVYNSSIGFFGTFTTTLEDGFPIDGGVGLGRGATRGLAGLGAPVHAALQPANLAVEHVRDSVHSREQVHPALLAAQRGASGGNRHLDDDLVGLGAGARPRDLDLGVGHAAQVALQAIELLANVVVCLGVKLHVSRLYLNVHNGCPQPNNSLGAKYV